MKKLKLYHWLIIAFIGMVIVGLGIGYVIDRSKNKSVQGIETQIVTPKVETPKTEVKKDEPKTEETVKQESNVPVKTKTVTTPQVTTPPAAVAVCDELQKQIYTQTFTVNFNDAKTEMMRLTDEVFAKKDDDTQQTELDQITHSFTDKIQLYYSQYLQNMKSINCPAEQLLELKQ